MKTKSLALRFHAKPCLDPTTGVGVCVCVPPRVVECQTARRCDQSERLVVWSSKALFLGFLHGFKLVDPLLCVALSDLSQGLVFVPAGLDVLAVKEVVLGVLGFITCLGQLLCQGLRADRDEVSRTEQIYLICSQMWNMQQAGKCTDKGSMLQPGWRAHRNCAWKQKHRLTKPAQLNRTWLVWFDLTDSRSAVGLWLWPGAVLGLRQPPRQTHAPTMGQGKGVSSPSVTGRVSKEATRYLSGLTFSCFCTRSFFSASVTRSSSLRWSLMLSMCRSALCVLLFSSLSLLSSRGSYMGGGGGGGGAIITCSSSWVFWRFSSASFAWLEST